MATENKKCDSNVSKEIVERPVDIFYSNISHVVNMSFENLPELVCDRNRSVEEFLAKMWDEHFSESDSISDFLRHFIYLTGLVGRFYKINRTMSIDDVFYLLKNRLPNPDTWFETWYNLHRIAYLVLVEVNQEHFSNVTLYLDLHISGANDCDNSGRRTKLLTLEDLSDGEELVLMHHITVYYRRYDICEVNRFRYSSTRSTESNVSGSNEDINSKSKVSETSKTTSSTKEVDSFVELPTDSGSSDQWHKYGARPKKKGASLKECSDTKENRKEYCTLDAHKPTDVHMCPRVMREDQLTRNRSRESENVERLNQMLEEELNKKSQDLSFPSYSNVAEHSATESNRFSQYDNAENRSATERFQEFSLPSHSVDSSAIDNDSPGQDKDYFRRLIGKISTYEISEKKSDSNVSVPFITQTSEDNSYSEKYGAKPKDKQSYKKCGCTAFSNKKECKADEMLEKGAVPSIIGKSRSDKDLICLPKFSEIKGLDRVFASEQDLAEMPKEMREVQMAYEDVVLGMMKAQAGCSIPASDADSSEQMPESFSYKQHKSDDQQDNFFQMPLISFPPRYTRQDDENSFNFPVNIGLQVRESILRHEMKTFFDNYSFSDAYAENKRDSVTARSSSSIAEYCSVFPPRTPMQILDSIYSSDKVNISDASNKDSELRRDDIGYLTVETYDDKISFNWEERDINKLPSIESLDPKFSKEVLKIKTNEMVFIDGVPMPLNTPKEHYDAFFEGFVHKLNEEPSVQKMSPEHPGSSQLSTHGIPTTSKNSPKRLEVLPSIQTNPPDNSDNESLYEISEGSFEFSDYYDNNSLGSVSEIEDDDKA